MRPLPAVSEESQSHKNQYAERWDDAIAACESTHRLSPGRLGTYYGIGTALLVQGEAGAALDAFGKETDEEYRVTGQALALHALGRREEYEQKLQEMIERWGDQWLSEVAHVYAWIGEADKAFEWLERAIDQNEAGLTEQSHQSFYLPVHEDPRWATLLERVGSAPEQLAAIEFRVTLPK